MIDAEILDFTSLRIRAMQSADLAQVLAMERNAQINPWGRISFEESLNKEHVCRVVHAVEKLVAYHIVCIVADELHVLNVVAAQQLQGQGLGHLLMQDIIELSQAQGLKKIFLEVRASNETAQALYSKWQFTQIAVRKGYYRAIKSANGATRRAPEDALIFVCDLKGR